MNRLLLGLMFLLTATAAMAEWTAIAENDELIVYVDTATIRRNGNLVKMWDLRDFKTIQTTASGASFLSSKAQNEYDCKEEKMRLLAFSWFSGQMGRGKVVFSHSDPEKWTPIGPDSIGETFWKIACGRR